MPTRFSIFVPLTPRSRWREFFANLRALVDGRRPSALTLRSRPTRIHYTDIPKGRFPGRGLLYSFLAHEIAIFGILTVSTAVQLAADYRRVQRVSWPPDDKLTYLLPELGGGSLGEKPVPVKPESKESGASPIHQQTDVSSAPAPARVSHANSTSAPAKTASAGKPGLVYPGPQPIVSNPPNPTNRIQTISQPELINPPALEVPLALPNMVTLARLTAPQPDYAPKVEAPPPSPAKIPSAPTLGPELHPLGWHFVNIQLTEPLPVPAQLTMPEMSSHKFTPLPENPDPVISVPKVSEAATSAAPVAPQLKPEMARNLVPAAPGIQERVVTVPKVSSPTPTGEGTPNPEAAQLKPELGGGTDAHSVLILSPIPGAPTPNPAIPPGEARGQFAIGPVPNLKAPPGAGIGLGVPGGSASASAPSSDSSPSETGGELVGSTSQTSGASGDSIDSGEGGGVVRQLTEETVFGTKPETGAGTAGTTAGSGEGGETGASPVTSKEKGSGTGAGTGIGPGSGEGSGPGTSPFPGISITGGSGTGVGSHPGANPTKTQPPTNVNYGLNIVATASSGGGLRDYGIFRNETVFTVYIASGQPQTPSWTLQYAEIGRAAPDPVVSTLTLSNLEDPQIQLTPPYPVDKEDPKFPPEVAARNSGGMVVIAGVITADGKLSQLRIVHSPNNQLNEPALQALSNWTFRPAERAGQPVALKILLGIPLSSPPQ